MINQKALHAFEVIDILKDCKPQNLEELRTLMDFSNPYLQQIVLPLRRAGILQSLRGWQGGYCLADLQQDVSAWDVVRVFSPEQWEVFDGVMEEVVEEWKEKLKNTVVISTEMTQGMGLLPKHKDNKSKNVDLHESKILEAFKAALPEISAIAKKNGFKITLKQDKFDSWYFHPKFITK